MKRKYFMICLFISIMLFGSHTSASAQSISECKDTPYYIETTISDAETFPNTYSYTSTNESKEITKTKTTRVKAKDGTTLWSVSITATFSYNGTTSKCISCSHSATSYAKTWSIKSVTSKKSGSEATATAIATHSNGILSNDFTQSVTIKCSGKGVIS